MYAKENDTSKFIFRKKILLFAYCYILSHTIMDEKEDKGVISVRPPEGSDLKQRLNDYAEATERSMNYHAVKAIDEYLTKHFTKPTKKSKPTNLNNA